MYKNLLIVLLFAFSGLFFSQCSDNEVEITKLQKETEYIHDEAMQDMAKMNRIGRQLKKEVGALDSIAPRRDSIVGVLVKMKAAEEEMMDWMKNYQAPDPKSAEAKAYLDNQKKLIEQNHRNICDALRAGEAIMPKK